MIASSNHLKSVNHCLLLDGSAKKSILNIKSLTLLLGLFFSLGAVAVNPDGDLRIEALNAPNFVVDSNVETPATYGPQAVHLGAKFCNDGANDLTDVIVNIGDFIGTPAASTPGTYPVEGVDEAANGWSYSGDFSLTHATSTGDASRLIGTIPAGECITQYWMVTYPTKDAGGNAVFGANADFSDDLVLDYDFWATATDGGSSLVADQTYSATMRRELSAAANKIWPNTTSKVPTEYLDAIEEELGWRPTTGSESTVAGGVGTVSGVWYDFGVVNKGFDNDGDLVPDYNAWAQPVGDPGIFDAGCFKLVRTYGILVVKLNDGTDLLIPFEDQLYFTDIPANNTGMVGLVYYEFQGIDGTCSIQISPYQEVASGRDNEKFNGDYGTFTGTITSTTPEVTIDKTADVSTVPLGSSITYSLSADNTTGTIGAGDASLGSPLVFNDTVPAGLEYVSGSAVAGFSTTQAGLGVVVRYSTDNGVTWTTSEPVPATDVTDIQWWLDDSLEAGNTVTVSFESVVPLTYTGLVVDNEACLSFGSSDSFDCDDEDVFVEGTLTISGTVFEDTADGGGILADGILNGTEPGHANTTVTLYLDLNGDGIIDATDPVWATTVSAVDGTYSFTNLPDGDFIVELDVDDPDLFTGTTTGWGLTSGQSIDVTLAGVDVTGVDFGIAPALDLTKTLIGTSPVGEGTEVTYNVTVTNLLRDPNGAVGNASCEYDFYSGAVYSAKTAFITDPTFAIGAPDATFALTGGGGDGDLAMDSFVITPQPEVIQKVEVVFFIQSTAAAWVDDQMFFDLQYKSTGLSVTGGATPFLTAAELNTVSTTTNTQVILDVTDDFIWTWTTPVDEGLYAFIAENKQAGSDPANIRIDSVALRYTTDCGGGGGTYDLDKTIIPLPVTDTFDATYLQFVSAVPSPDSFDNVAGTITWDDVGPLNAGASRTLQVTFLTQLPGTTTVTNVLNTGTVDSAQFANGLSTNTATDDALIDIEPRVELSGTVWNDSTGTTAGWTGAVGYDGSDTFISGVTVELWACLDGAGDVMNATNTQSNKQCQQNAGTWTQVDTTTTDSNGDYLFTGLERGYYYVEIDTTTLPGTISQAGDPDETPGSCTTCDSRWHDPLDTLNQFLEVPATPGDITEINFGYDVNPAVYGNVWEDKDGDGTGPEIGETPLSGWTVELQDGVCVPNSTCPTTLTDANGDYAFGDLTAGTTYIIVTVPPADTASSVWTETFESDASINNAITVTLSAGEISGSHDFAFQQTGYSTFGDTVFVDWNGNGVQDPEDEGIPNVTINLYEDVDGDGILDISVDPFITTTSSTGTYLYSNLPAGDFFAVVDETTLPTGFSQTADPDEVGTCTVCDARNMGTVDGTLGNDYLLADFGYTPVGTASIGDQVFFDNDGDGIVDAGETGIANITVTLQVDYDGDGTYVTIQTTSTDSNGLYSFDGLPDANYRVVMDTADADLPDDSFGNDGVMTTASSLDVVISSGDVTSVGGIACVSCSDTVDFGYGILAAIGDTIFEDTNGNALQDTGEPGIAGVTVELYDPDGVFVTSTVTDANGAYLFTGITPLFDGLGVAREYEVRVNTGSLPAGYTITGDPDRDGIACSDTSYDSSPTPPPACDHNTSVALSYGTNFMGADFGYQPPGSFGDFIWNDVDGDGVQDFGEPGLAGVTITVTGPGGPYTTTTDADGYYSFGNLPDGAYTVTIDATNFNPGGALENYAASSDPDGLADDTTTLIISGGSVTTLGGSACSNCDLDVDFAYQLNGTFSVSGSVCFENGGTDNGSCSDVDDDGVSGQTVYLYDSSGNLVGTAATDGNGDYTFSNLPAGTYQAAVSTTSAPLSFGEDTTTAGNSPFTGTLNSYTDSGTSIIQNITIAASETLLDFAFNLTQNIDFGDLPESGNPSYTTTLSTGGAYHIQDAVDTLYMGVTVDTESDGSPSAQADGDGADEDGLGFGILSDWTVGSNGAILQIQIGGSVGSGYVVGWIDFNNDGDFTDTGETIISSNVVNGYAYFNIDVPVGATLDSQIYSRFRLFESAPPISTLAFSGAYTKGEVEDYILDFRVPGVIGDKVWLDEDGDGIDDIFEPGLANVTVNLYDSTNTLIATTTTDVNGEYLFTGVYAGDYYVDIASGIPAGLQLHSSQTDPSSTFALANAEEKLDVDFGYVPTPGTAVIGDQVFSDANNNGQQDPGEIGISGITMSLVSGPGVDGEYGTGDDVVVATTSTLSDGTYLFTGVTPGEYVVTVDDTGLVLSGYTVTFGPQSPGDNETEPFTVVADQIYTDADFGYVNGALSSYTDRVWLDANNDSLYASEQGIEGVTISLVDSSGDIVATTVSSADGTFSFTGLPNGVTYDVVVTDIDNVLGTLDPTTVGATNGQVTIVTAGTDVDVSNSGPSFGYYEPGGVSGIVYSDADGDGVRDPGEAAISGVTVELQGSGCVSGSTCPTTTTAIDGSYLFDGYLPTNYTVVVNPVAGVGTTLTGYTQTGDPDASIDNETSVTIIAGEIDEGNDFGYQNTSLADISGTVFYDTDADGVYEINGNDGDAGTTGDNEYGLTQVTVQLQDGNGNIIATTTVDGNGDYTFPDLPAGNYEVVVTDTNGVLSGLESTSGLDYRSVTLAAIDITDIDFGYVDDPQTGAIGDTVWLDSDSDGVQDPSEPGLAFVNLELFEDTNGNGVLDGGDTSVGTTTTDADGHYRFDSLTSGNYFVDVIEATVPSNLTATNNVAGYTDMIGLSEGEYVEDADFGFAPDSGTGILSGVVWSDVDSDGIRDNNEVGIGQVTVTVIDSNNPSTTYSVDSNPDGSWMVTGLPPGDYSIYYDSADIPASYANPTQPTNFVAPNDTYSVSLAADQTINNLDFGFDPATATGGLTGTVYNDLDGDATFDNPVAGTQGVESGIWEVTLNLIDCGAGTCDDGDENIIASTITDQNGDYGFLGIQPGTYQVQISDINGTLDGLNPTELLPASSVVVANVTTTDVDAGFNSGNSLGSIGNLVFLDVNSDSAWQIGEPGIQGVSLECWSDENENGVIEPGTDNLIRTVLTDENGEYYCNSVPTGYYVVRVTDRDGRLAGYTSTGTANPGDVDNHSNISPMPLQTASPNYKADFGYEGTLLISGTVYEDVDNNGTNNAGDNVVNGATVRLIDDLNSNGVYDAGEPVVNNTTTNGSGNYTFTSVPAGDYILVPDTSGTSVNGYAQTEPTTNNGMIAVTVGPNSTGNDFGFYDNGVTTTPVTLAHFKAIRTNNGTMFDWSTETELGNIGFVIYQELDSGQLVALTDMIPSMVVDSMEPQFYSASTSNTDVETVWISDFDRLGTETKHGPFTVNIEYGEEAGYVETIDWATINSEHNRLADQRNYNSVTSVSALNLKVSEDGVYRVTFEELLAAGLDLTGVAINRLEFTSQGNQVPVYIESADSIMGEGDFIEFIGESVKDSLYTRTNIYKLSVSENGRGLSRIIDNNTLFGEVDTSGYYLKELYKDENLGYTYAAPGDDPWYRDRLLAYGSNVSKTYEFNLDERLYGSVELKYDIWGGTDFAGIIDHNIQIKVNGVLVDTQIFDGHESVQNSITVSEDLLQTGNNTVELIATVDNGVNYSLIYTNWIGVEFNQSIIVENDYLHFRGLSDLIFKDSVEDNVSSVSGLMAKGLSSDQIRVYSVDGENVERLTSLDIRNGDSGYTVSFADVSTNHEYIVFNDSMIKSPVLEPANEITGLIDREVQYLMISHPDFISSLTPLVNYHESNGLKVKVVDVSDIYASYSYGLIDPDAIRQYIYDFARVSDLKYVLLAGADTLDPLNYKGLGSFSFIPTNYVTTQSIINYTPSDIPYVDIDNDNIQDYALGRFPARTVAEMESMIAKTLQYSTNNYQYTSIFSADYRDAGGDFKAYSETLADAMNGSWIVENAYLDDYPVADAKQRIIDEINSGVSFVSYFGHSGPSRWSFQSLLNMNDLNNLSNTDKATVVVQWGCWNAYYVSENVRTMAHKFMTTDAGAAAVLGASTLTTIESDQLLGELFMSTSTSPGMTIGEALVDSKVILGSQHPDYLDVLLGYTILGDPALRLTP